MAFTPHGKCAELCQEHGMSFIQEYSPTINEWASRFYDSDGRLIVQVTHKSYATSAGKAHRALEHALKVAALQEAEAKRRKAADELDEQPPNKGFRQDR